VLPSSGVVFGFIEMFTGNPVRAVNRPDNSQPPRILSEMPPLFMYWRPFPNGNW
jgi:hypothetical protein